MALPPRFDFLISCPWPRPGFYTATILEPSHGNLMERLDLLNSCSAPSLHHLSERPGRYLGTVVLPSGLQSEHLSKTARSNTNRRVEGHRKRQPGDINADTLSLWKECFPQCFPPLRPVAFREGCSI